MAEHIIEAPVTSLNAGAGSVAPPSTGEIHVIPQPIAAAPAPKPGTAKAAMFANLRSRAKAEGPAAEPASPVAPAAPATVKAAPVAEPKSEPVTEEEFAIGDDVDEVAKPAAAEPKAEPVAGTEPAAAEPKPKVSPWKLVDEWKERARKVEQEVVEIKKLIPNEEARKQEMAQIETIRKRNAELEAEIRNVSFAKSEEFKTKFEQPYNQAWERAMSEVSEITVLDAESGEERKATSGDIMEIVNLPLGQARKQAEEKFGSFADDVMSHRKAIRELHQASNTALEAARASGEEVQKSRMAQFQQMREAMNREVGTHWEAFNQAIVKDKRFGKFFAPAQGDTEGNTRLEKGFKMVDAALAMNPLDPRLNPEQRKEAVRLHTAIRNRAAAFGRMASMVAQKESRIAQLESELKQYKGSAPEAGGSSTPAAVAPVNARGSVIGALHKLAK